MPPSSLLSLPLGLLSLQTQPVRQRVQARALVHLQDGRARHSWPRTGLSRRTCLVLVLEAIQAFVPWIVNSKRCVFEAGHCGKLCTGNGSTTGPPAACNATACCGRILGVATLDASLWCVYKEWHCVLLFVSLSMTRARQAMLCPDAVRNELLKRGGRVKLFTLQP